jgi:hypothetical protein
MSNDFNIEDLIHELTILDPSLAGREADLRVIIAELREKKPHIIIDPTYVRALRARLLLRTRVIVSPYAKLSWWALRLTPVGALALLLLILTPGGMFETRTTTPVSTPSSHTVNDTEILRIEMSEDPTQSSNPYETNLSDSIDSTAQMKTMGGPEVFNEPSPLIIAPQSAGVRVTITSVTTEHAGFIVIYAHLPDGREEIIGVSPLVLPGVTEHIPVYLRVPTKMGSLYTAVLYKDNGNRLFTETDDMPTVTTHGNVVRSQIEVVAGG